LEIINNYENFKLSHSALTIGGFDGLHLGHLEIINKLKNISIEKSVPSVVITFDPIPKSYFNKGIRSILSLSQKSKLLDKRDIDYLIVIRFDDLFSKLDAYKFLERICKNINPQDIVIGSDHSFGYNRTGNAQFLEKYSKNFNYTLVVLPDKYINNKGVSSSLIRDSILDKKVEFASDLLGYNYFIDGKVVKGKGIGRKLGFPTANIELIDAQAIVPGNGVYCVTLEYNSNSFKGMCNIGIRPTVDNDGLRSIEVHVFTDEDLNLYEKNVRVSFLSLLRKEKTYKDIKELAKQLEKDRYACIGNN